MISTATSVTEYLSNLPPERRAILSEVRSQILKHLPEGYEEAMNWGMITYQVPLTRYPDTYNKQPLMYAALASQKNHLAVYLMSVYAMPGEDAWLDREFARRGKKLNMGKSCIRFRRLDDLALEPIMKIIASTDVDSFIDQARAAHE